jgi:hypothetical protein
MKLAPSLLKALCIASVVLVASCTKEVPPPLPVAVIPPAAPPPPPVALPQIVLENASAYRAYINRAAAISPAFADGAAVQRAVESAAAWEAKQFLRGAISYAAILALQSPQFVAGVRTYAVDATTRRELADRLVHDPNYAAALPSAAGAAGLVSTALAADGAKVRRAGELVKQAAYDVQRQNWSKADVVGRDARLALAKTLSAQPVAPVPEDVTLLQTAVSGRDQTGLSVLGVDSEPLNAPYTQVVYRGLALAALAALGEAASAEREPGMMSLLEENTAGFCLNMSKLNLFQCLSVAKPYYEDVFCLGPHILLDTAPCVTKAAGDPPAAAVASAAPPPGAAALVSTTP